MFASYGYLLPVLQCDRPDKKQREKRNRTSVCNTNQTRCNFTTLQVEVCRICVFFVPPNDDDDYDGRRLVVSYRFGVKRRPTKTDESCQSTTEEELPEEGGSTVLGDDSSANTFAGHVYCCCSLFDR